MAAADRERTATLIDELVEDPYRFDFFQALRLIQNEYGDKPKIGDAKRLRDERFRLGQKPTLEFAPATFAEANRNEKDIVELAVYFWGLHGPNGAMPLAITEFLIERKLRHQDETLRRFMDIFHHRALVLFFKAWAINNKAVDYERGDQSSFRLYINALIGLATEGMANRDTVGEDAKLYFSSHLSAPTTHASGLISIISDYFEMPARIEEFVGRWMRLPEESIAIMGHRNGELGATAIVGQLIWNCQLRFRLILGPITKAQLKRMLPTGLSFKRLRDWVSLYLGRQLEWEVQIIVRRDEVPLAQLGQDAYLGWTTWIYNNPITSDRGDLILVADHLD